MSKDTSEELRSSWNPWLGVLVAILALFGSQILVGLVISIYPYFKGWSTTQTNDWLTNSIGAQFVFILIAEAVTVGSVYLFVRRYKDGLLKIGIRKPKWMDLVYGFMGLPAYLLIYFLFLSIATHFFPALNANQKQQLGFNNPHGTLELALTFISLVILPPIAEEIIFRGLIYTSLKKLMRIWGAVIVTSIMFALGHLPEGGTSGPLYIAAVDTFTLSLILIYLREKTNGLWASMTLHALKNAIAFVALFALHLG